MDDNLGVEIVDSLKVEAFRESFAFGGLSGDIAANLLLGLQRENITEFELSCEFGHSFTWWRKRCKVPNLFHTLLGMFLQFTFWIGV